jgi:antitoxin VapB
MSSRDAAPVHAKLFQTGGSQAVRLPKAFRLPGDEVVVRRVGEAIVLEPLRSGPGWSEELVRFLRSPAEHLVDREQPAAHERDDIRL